MYTNKYIYKTSNNNKQTLFICVLLLEIQLSCYTIFSFMCNVLFIVLSVLLRFTDSDYPFSIFKLFLRGRLGSH